MQDISEVIDLYLSMETAYAVMISGPWGSGKTYFVKNSLIPKIEATPLKQDNTKHYRPVLVSLFGQKSIDEVQASILLSLFPFAGNKFAKLGGILAKGLFKGALKLGGFDAFPDGTAGTHFDSKDWIKFEELVLIFDDLERRHKDLPLEEVLGFINSLVEAGNNKVLIITHEKEQKDQHYHDLKEKTVGITVIFQPDLMVSMKNIITTRFASSPLYQRFLLDNAGSITAAFLKQSKNLRIFTYWLSYFQFVFSQLEDVLDGIEPLENNKNVILLELLHFSMAIAIEYKGGHIWLGNTNELDRENFMTLTALFAERLRQQAKDKGNNTDKPKPYF